MRGSPSVGLLVVHLVTGGMVKTERRTEDVSEEDGDQCDPEQEDTSDEEEGSNGRQALMNPNATEIIRKTRGSLCCTLRTTS